MNYTAFFAFVPWPSVLSILFIPSFTGNIWLELKQIENHDGFAESGALGELYLPDIGVSAEASPGLDNLVCDLSLCFSLVSIASEPHGKFVEAKLASSSLITHSARHSDV